tara:strand:+ start:484 stop:846 length:363 start_codon:yes stop_codon:yes gene_type:complete
MAKPGDTYTFTTLFLDGLNQPVEVEDPVIEVFAFTADGEKAFIVPTDTPMAPVEDEQGRYTHTFEVPLNYVYSSTVFGIMKGVSDGFTILVEDQLEVSDGSGGGGGSGNDRMIARFVKGG